MFLKSLSVQLSTRHFCSWCRTKYRPVSCCQSSLDVQTLITCSYSYAEHVSEPASGIRQNTKMSFIAVTLPINLIPRKSSPVVAIDNVVSKCPLKYPIKQHYNLLYFVKCPFWLSLTTQNHFPLITLYMYICLHLESSGSKGIDPSSTQDTSHDKNCYYITAARVPNDTATGATMVANLLDPLAMRFR